MLTNRLAFNVRYFALAIILFLTEILIAVYIHDEIIRPFIGDFLVVIFLYCLLKSFVNASVWGAALSVLLFAYLVETLQYFRIVYVLGLEHSTLARVVIGTYFTWTDIWMYTLGIFLVVLTEAILKRRAKPAS